MKQIHQGHGNHWGCIYDDLENLIEFLPTALENANNILSHTTQYFDERNQTEQESVVIGMGYPINESVEYFILSVKNYVQKQLDVVSFYPHINNGVVYPLTLTHIQPWDNQIEGLLTAEDSHGMSICFLDTLFFKHKDRYQIGKEYPFTLSAFAYFAEILKETTFSFEGQQAIDFLAKTGEKPTYKDGKVEPLIFDMSGMMAFFQLEDEMPENAEFQSPIHSVESLSIEGNDFYRIAITPWEGLKEQDLTLPLYIKKQLVTDTLTVDTPIRGKIWLQGHLLLDSDFASI